MNALRFIRLALLCLAAALLVAGCGSSKSSSSSANASSTPTTGQTTPAAAAPIANPFPKPHMGPHPGAKVDHLIVRDIVKGTGAELRSGDSGLFDYIGTIYVNGKSLGSSWGKKSPAPLDIDHGRVIDGWWQGVPGMRVGGRRVLIIPASLSFTNSINPGIVGKATYFDIVLRKVIPAQPAGAAPAGQGTTAGQ